MKVFKLAALTAMMSLAAGAQAGTVASQLFSGFQQLSDNSADYQSFDANGDGLLGVGDILTGIFTIESIEQGPYTRHFGAGSGNHELTGVFEAVVTTYFNPIPGAHFYTFAPTAAFQALYGPGALIATFDDPANDYSRVGSGSIANLTATANGGTPFVTLGYTGGHNFWTAQTRTNDISIISTLPVPAIGGEFNGGLDILAQGPAAAGLVFNQVPCFNGVSIVNVDVCGSGTILPTGGAVTPFHNFDNVDFAVNVSRVPEPATLGLLGLGLMGLGLMGLGLPRRRKA